MSQWYYIQGRTKSQLKSLTCSSQQSWHLPCCSVLGYSCQIVSGRRTTQDAHPSPQSRWSQPPLTAQWTPSSPLDMPAAGTTTTTFHLLNRLATISCGVTRFSSVETDAVVTMALFFICYNCPFLFSHNRAICADRTHWPDTCESWVTWLIQHNREKHIFGRKGKLSSFKHVSDLNNETSYFHLQYVVEV